MTDSEDPNKLLKTNLMDVLVLLLKMVTWQCGNPTLRLNRSSLRPAENADLHMAKGLEGSFVLKLVEGQDPNNSKIILPHGQSPLTIL